MILNKIYGNDLVLLSSVISVIISEDLSSEELDILGNFFSTLGSNLSTIAVAKFK